MESDRLFLGALIFILIIVGSNFVMYALARGAAKGDGRWMKTLRETLNKPIHDSATNKSMDELRSRIQELENKKNGE